MITETVLAGLLAVVDAVLGLLPAPNIQIPATVFTTAHQYYNIAKLVLPFGTVSAIITILITLQSIRIAVSFIKTAWSLLPFV